MKVVDEYVDDWWAAEVRDDGEGGDRWRRESNVELKKALAKFKADYRAAQAEQMVEEAREEGADGR